jgi:hypothetical protein
MHVRSYPKSIAMSAWRQSNVCFAAESGLQAGFPVTADAAVISPM